MTRIFSPVATGSGAFVVHGLLAGGLPGYTLCPYNPWWTLFPPALRLWTDYSADLVHAPLDYAAWSGIRNKPLVGTLHGFVFDAMARQHASMLQALHYSTDLLWNVRASLRRTTTVTVVSRHLDRCLRETLGYTGPSRVIYNGVDSDQFIPRSPRRQPGKPMRVLFVGKLTRHKGADLLPAILDRLAPGIELVYTGTGAGLGVRHTRARALGSIPLSGMPAVYQDVDLLLAPARREGFGMAIAEAMSCGLPVIATDCAAIPELVEHGRGGFLCPMNDVAEFADAVNRLAQTPELRHEFGSFNRARVESRFGLRRMLKEYRQLFDEVLSVAAPDS